MTLVIVALGAMSALGVGACGFEVPDVVQQTNDSGTSDVTIDDGGLVDARDADADVGLPTCNPNAPFAAPVLVAELADPNVSFESREPRLSADERTIYFSFGPAGGTFVLFYASRPSASVPFGAKAAVAGLTGGSGSDNNITLSADGLVALISSNRTSGANNPKSSQIWSTTRANLSAPFAAPQWAQNKFGSTSDDMDPFFIPDAGGLFYAAHIDYFDQNVVKIKRWTYGGGTTYSAATGPAFSPPNAAAKDRAPVLTPDELRIFYATNAAPDGGVVAGGNIWTASRPDRAVGWGTPSIVTELAGFGTYPRPGWVSANGCRLYLTSNKSGRNLIYLAQRGK